MNGTSAIKDVDALDLEMTPLNTCEHWKATTCIEMKTFCFYKYKCFNVCFNIHYNFNFY